MKTSVGKNQGIEESGIFKVSKELNQDTVKNEFNPCENLCWTVKLPSGNSSHG